MCGNLNIKVQEFDSEDSVVCVDVNEIEDVKRLMKAANLDLQTLESWIIYDANDTYMWQYLKGAYEVMKRFNKILKLGVDLEKERILC